MMCRGGCLTRIAPTSIAALAAMVRCALSAGLRSCAAIMLSATTEAHVWLKDTGKQVYLGEALVLLGCIDDLTGVHCSGGFEKEEFAAEAFDIACLKAKGHTKARACGLLVRYTKAEHAIWPTGKNQLPHRDLRRAASIPGLSLHGGARDGCAPVSLMPETIERSRFRHLTTRLLHVRQSQGFARGTSTFRGVTRHPNGRWEARMGVPGSRHIYLGLFEVEEEAARAYDRALVRLRGPASATNFSLSDYGEQLREYEAERAPSEMPAQPSASALEWPFESDDLCC